MASPEVSRQLRPAITPPSTSQIAPVIQLALSDSINTLGLRLLFREIVF
jgi:hypothetical protein